MECLRCGSTLAGLAHPHNCPGPQSFDWFRADIEEGD